MPMQPIGGPLNFDQGPLGPPLMQAPPAPKKKGGMFGSGLGVGEAIVAALNGYLAGRGNPVGIANMQMMNQRRHQMADEAAHQNDRENDFQDWVRKQAYAASNPGPVDPTAFQKDYAWYQQNLPNMAEGFAKAHADSGGSAFGRMFTDPSTGQQYMLGGQAGPQVGAIVDDPRAGGPTPQASGGFPRSY